MVTPTWCPPVDVMETPESYVVRTELPGLGKDDVKISIDQRVLRIEGERKEEKEEKGRSWLRVERAFGNFVRCFALPDNVDESNTRAEFKDGILAVHIMKGVTPESKTIEIKGG